MSLARRARLATGLSQRDFARLIGTSHVTVARWEAGHRRPSALARTLFELLLRETRTCVHALWERADPDEEGAHGC